MTASDAENCSSTCLCAIQAFAEPADSHPSAVGEVDPQLWERPGVPSKNGVPFPNLTSAFLGPWCSVVGQDREVGGEAVPVCRQNLAVDQTTLEHHGLQQESWWALGGPQPLIFTILAPSLAGKMGKGLLGISNWTHTNRAFPCTLTSTGECLS